MHSDGDVRAEAVEAGAVGYLVKDCSTEEVVERDPGRGRCRRGAVARAGRINALAGQPVGER